MPYHLVRTLIGSLTVYCYVWSSFANVLNNNTFAYIGQPEQVNATLLTLGGYRHYDPHNGIFLKQDSYSPFLNIGTVNSFNYSAGNPIMQADPSGHMPEEFEIIDEMIEGNSNATSASSTFRIIKNKFSRTWTTAFVGATSKSQQIFQSITRAMSDFWAIEPETESETAAQALARKGTTNMATEPQLILPPKPRTNTLMREMVNNWLQQEINPSPVMLNSMPIQPGEDIPINHLPYTEDPTIQEPFEIEDFVLIHKNDKGEIEHAYHDTILRKLKIISRGCPDGSTQVTYSKSNYR